ncbi:galactose-1-phosphate uridylyltransferase [Rhodopirellula sp. SM50]|nr:DUF4921 family protein [Rhodopirellula sp. SM50]PAY21057.1 galactose-1-phosphate uridylyltransferase [Rhodopirellula sp. SM50]
MSSDSEQQPQIVSAESALPRQVSEAVSEYQAKPGTIDTDTRLASAGETEAMWPGRPPRRSVMRSLARSDADTKSRKEAAAYRGSSATSHTRRDLLTGDWTIFAPKRDQRPNDYESDKQPSVATAAEHPAFEHSTFERPDVDAACPFCAGAENRTPEAVWSAKLGDQTTTPLDSAATRFAGPAVEVVPGEQANWDVRVVPNKFPAVSPCDAEKGGHVDRHNLFPITDVVGGHEVIVESSLHAESITQYDPAMVYMTLLAFRDRIRHWRQVRGINYISVFKNCGPEAGASLRHSHSQLIATSLMPHHVRTTLLRCEHHRARTGCTLACDLLRAELAERSRVIDRTDSFVAFCPFASRFGGMIRLTSVEHQPHFDRMTETSLDQLSSFLWRVLCWVNEAFPGKAFNYLLHTCPPGGQQPEAFQWSLDVFPRLNKTAGFEWSCDCMINSLLPETAALRYREIARRHDPRNVLLTR